MKLVYIILALYTTTLAVYPCSDDVCDDTDSAVESSIKQKGDHESEEDVCSPFCICSCCASRVQLTVSGFLLPSSFPHNTKLVTPYQEKATITTAHTIWQPPWIA